MKRQFNKIKFDGSHVYLAYDEINEETGAKNEHTVKSTEKPTPAFISTLGSLRSDVAEWVDQLNEWGNNLDIRGVSLSWTDGIMGACITALKPLENSRSPLVINTPHKPKTPYSEGDPDGDNYCLTTDCAEAIERLIKVAEGFLDGERAQTSLDLHDDPPMRVVRKEFSMAGI